MISLKLTSTKQFTQHLLLKDTFDRFLFIEGEIVTYNIFKIDGYIQKEFYSHADSPVLTHTGGILDYAYWSQNRDFCFSLIKGKRVPLSFKFIFSLSPANIAKLIEQNHLDFQPEDVQGLYLNIRFEEDELRCITGTSLKTFSMDKSLEQAWDKMVQKFFIQKEIPYEEEL